MDMAHREVQEQGANDPVKETSDTEKHFLKELYNFMKKRDTPIERIPNLGFKQIDLFVLFTTVRDLGGYHQVTAQQLWKQVYNTLGGNPRSTSAATCTRRHYEKLLLPYECHVKGLSMNLLPHRQLKHFHSSYSKDRDDGLIPAKRNLLSVPLHQQNLHTLQSDQQSACHLPLHYPHYYHQNHPVRPPHVPISSSVSTPQTPSAPLPNFSFDPYCLNPTETVKEPLEHLRYLAERYKTSSGLTEPLNLSVKASRPETINSPASSFSPPSSSKNPKFLNKPFPLYSPHCPQVVRSERCEMQDSEAGLGSTPYSFPVKAPEAFVVNIKATTPSSSPKYDSTPRLQTEEGPAAVAQNPSSPKPAFTLTMEKKEGSPEIRRHSLSHIMPSLPRENEKGEMEIEIPLSVFHNWLRLCTSSAIKQDHRQRPAVPILEEHSGQMICSDTDVLPTNQTFPMNPQHRNFVAEDLRLRQRNVPSPTPAIQTFSDHYNMSHNPFTSYKSLSSSGILKNAVSRNLFDQPDVNKSYSPKHTNCCNACDQETPVQAKIDSNSVMVQQDYEASKSCSTDTVQQGKEKSERSHSAVLMLNSSSTSLLHLTNEEVMKLKKIISTSS